MRTVQCKVGSRSKSQGKGRARGVGRGAVEKSPTVVSGETDSKLTGTSRMEGQSKREEDGNDCVRAAAGH